MQRIPLGPRSGNIRQGPELTLVAKAKIVGAQDFGGTPTAIGRKYKLSESTIWSTLSLDVERVHSALKPRSG
jgi:hypothetical protein